MNFETIRHIHFVGIKGVAMAALAIVANERGIAVSGSDSSEVFPTDALLLQKNIVVSSGFSAKNIPVQTDLVIYTGAHHGEENPEVKFADSQKIPILPHGKALGLFMEGKRAISVAGSHGKTTTSAMIASVLMTQGFDPSFAVGCGEILNLKTPAHAGKGDWFVAEADEYVTDPHHDPTPRFLWQKPEILVITNIDFDHPDVYHDIKQIQQTFAKFSENVTASGSLVINADDLPTQEIKKQLKKEQVSFGFSEKAQYRISDIQSGSGRTLFVVHVGNKSTSITLKIPGVHNVFNATAAFAALLEAGLTEEQISRGLGEFAGTKRRFELIRQKNDKILIDDYAHHPKEIAATLGAARNWYQDRRLVVIFQPHTYSRTQKLLTEFGTCFSSADVVLISDIYASARETKPEGLNGENVVKEVKKHKKEVSYAPNKEAVLQYIGTFSRPNDLIITMGAGDIYTWIPDIAEVL